MTYKRPVNWIKRLLVWMFQEKESFRLTWAIMTPSCWSTFVCRKFIMTWRWKLAIHLNSNLIIAHPRNVMLKLHCCGRPRQNLCWFQGSAQLLSDQVRTRRRNGESTWDAQDSRRHCDARCGRRCGNLKHLHDTYLIGFIIFLLLKFLYGLRLQMTLVQDLAYGS